MKQVPENLYTEYVKVERETRLLELEMYAIIKENAATHGREQAIDIMIGRVGERAEVIRRKRLEVFREICFVMELPIGKNYEINRNREVVMLPGVDDWRPVESPEMGAVQWIG